MCDREWTLEASARFDTDWDNRVLQENGLTLSDAWSVNYLEGIVGELRKLPQETEWVEFKLNDAEPSKIGEYISALSNSAAVAGKAFG
ncbi:MAG: AlbA family DNA-binding domain-containing protein [Gaiellaceae bacterium]